MSPAPSSFDFADLATRWLDGIATPEEAARLWSAIKGNPDCARTFADIARFELLLESTSQSLAREALVCAVADEKTARYRHRKRVTGTAKLAAGFLLFGSIVWMLWPVREPSSEVASTQAAPKANAIVQSKTQARPDRVVISPSPALAASAVDGAKTRPLPQHLDEFFLTSVQLNKVRLQDAVRQMEDQLRALNFGRAPKLDQLRVVLPASAMNREVTFKSGGISFLKALRAVAALAGCEVLATDSNVVLNTRKDGLHQIEQTRTSRSLLAADGIGRHTHLADLLEDARAIGMATDDSTQETLRGTSAQFEALALMADSRHQVRMMPDMSFLAYLAPAKPTDTSRVLTAEEVEQKAKEAPASATVIRVDPGSTVPSSAPAANANLMITAVPAGDGTQVTISPNSYATGTSSVPPGLSTQLPIEILLPPGSGGNLTFPITTGALAANSTVPEGSLRFGAGTTSAMAGMDSSSMDWAAVVTLGGTGSVANYVAAPDVTIANRSSLAKVGTGGLNVASASNGRIMATTDNTFTGNIVVQSGTLTINGVVYGAGSVISSSGIPAGANLIFTPVTQAATTNPE